LVSAQISQLANGFPRGILIVVACQRLREQFVYLRHSHSESISSARQGPGKRIIKGRPFGVGFDRRIITYKERPHE
jgi:hypothetical protein